MNAKVVCLLLLTVLAFATITNVIAAFNTQSTGKVSSPRATSHNDNFEAKPTGDPVGGIPCPKNETGG